MAMKSTKPKVKITVKASTSGGKANTPSISRGTSIAQSPKITGGKVAAKKPSLASQATKAASKVVGRAKSVAREVRDIPTAIGTMATANKGKAVKSAAKENLKIQIRDVAKAAKGNKGVRSAQTVRSGRAIKSK